MAVLEFLAQQTGVLGKVNMSKYTIRYTAFDEDFSKCKTKIRVYKTSDGYALEFQRREGSSVVFNNLYASWDAKPKVSLPLPHDAPLEGNLLPVLDMLGSPCTNTQAEAIAWLASWVCRGELDVRELLGAGLVEEIIRNMSGQKDAALSYPANKILDYV